MEKCISGQSKSSNLYLGWMLWYFSLQSYYVNVCERFYHIVLHTCCRVMISRRHGYLDIYLQPKLPEAKVSWFLCLGRLVSKIDNAMHLLHLIGKTSKWAADNYCSTTIVHCLLLRDNWSLSPLPSKTGKGLLWHSPY